MTGTINRYTIYTEENRDENIGPCLVKNYDDYNIYCPPSTELDVFQVSVFLGVFLLAATLVIFLGKS